jgi:hypothetical protein
MSGAPLLTSRTMPLRANILRRQDKGADQCVVHLAAQPLPMPVPAAAIGGVFNQQQHSRLDFAKLVYAHTSILRIPMDPSRSDELLHTEPLSRRLIVPLRGFFPCFLLP